RPGSVEEIEQVRRETRGTDGRSEEQGAERDGVQRLGLPDSMILSGGGSLPEVGAQTVEEAPMGFGRGCVTIVRTQSERPGAMEGTRILVSGCQRTKAPSGAASRRSSAGSERAEPRFSTSTSIKT